MKRTVSLMLSLLVAVAVLAAAAPAQAGAGDSRSCVTTREFKAIKKGQSKPVVARLLDGRGAAVNAKARRYAKCGSRAKVVVVFNKKYGSATGVRVRRKKIVQPRKTRTPIVTNETGSYSPASTYNCPSKAPIKGNESSMIYHPPSSPWYAQTTPEQCFASEAGARAAGFRRAEY